MHLSLSFIVTTFYLVALSNIISVVRACGREDFEGVWHCELPQLITSIISDSLLSITYIRIVLSHLTCYRCLAIFWNAVAGDEDCQYTETSYESNCNVIGYFTKDYIKEKNGKCTFGYNSEGRKL